MTGLVGGRAARLPTSPLVSNLEPEMPPVQTIPIHSPEELHTFRIQIFYVDSPIMQPDGSHLLEQWDDTLVNVNLFQVIAFVMQRCQNLHIHLQRFSCEAQMSDSDYIVDSIFNLVEMPVPEGEQLFLQIGIDCHYRQGPNEYVRPYHYILITLDE